METAIFLCEPPARINANSVILLPLFPVFPLPTISQVPPPSSLLLIALSSLCFPSTLCPKHTLFSYHLYIWFHISKVSLMWPCTTRAFCHKHQPSLVPPLFFTVLSIPAIFFFLFVLHSCVTTFSYLLTDHIFAYSVNANSSRLESFSDRLSDWRRETHMRSAHMSGSTQHLRQTDRPTWSYEQTLFSNPHTHTHTQDAWPSSLTPLP